MAQLLDKIASRVAPLYGNMVAKQLNKYGLTFGDVMMVTPAAAIALERLPQAERHLRQKRMVRALDLSLKHEVLPVEEQAKQQPWSSPLLELTLEVEAELAEREFIQNHC